MRLTGARVPALDGLRGLAVLLVMAGHAIPVMPESLGNTGVGIFFALSGFLITGLLLEERAERGHVRLGAFYARRAGRLLPGLLLMLAVTAPAFVLIGAGSVAWNAIPALFYFTNYATIAHGSHLLGYGQTWSLAVEEHFYLIWPLLLMWTLRRSAGPARTLLAVAAGGAVLSLGWRIIADAFDLIPDRMLYVGTFERADSLLVGCALAVVLKMGWRPSVWLAAPGWGLILVNVAFAERLTSVWTSAVLAVGGAMVVASVMASAPRWLESRWLLWTGARSYGIYLWHGTLLTFALLAEGSTTTSGVVISAVTLAVAAGSYRWVEVPARQWVRARSRGAEVMARHLGDVEVQAPARDLRGEELNVVARRQ